MMIKKESDVDRLTEGPSYWYMAFELLRTEQYEQAAEFLRAAQAASEHSDEAILADILAATRRICLICSQCQSEVMRHRQACEEAGRLEVELRQDLYAILDLFRKYYAPDYEGECSPASPIEVEMPGLLHRLQRLLGWGPNDPRSEKASTSQSTRAIAITRLKTVNGQVELPDEIGTAHGTGPPDSERPLGQNPHSLAIYCLGPFRVFENGLLIDSCSSRKGWSVFKYLVAHRHAPVSKDILMDVFWPEADPEAARRNLHQAIYALRQTLKTNDRQFQHIQFENDRYRLNPNLDLWLDYEEFEQRVEKGRSFEQMQAVDEAMAEFGIAVGLYQGDFMAEDLYEDWPQPRRQTFWQSFLIIAHRLAEHYLSRKEYAAAISASQRILTMDQAQEQAHQNLMRCYLAQGQRHLALRQYQLCAQALKTDLDLSPSVETQAVYEKVVG